LAPETTVASISFCCDERAFGDEQITIAAQVIAYFNYINRIAEGLGVDLEDSMSAPIGQWHADKADFRDS